MKVKSFAGMRCSVAGTLELIGDRWTLLLLRDFNFGLTRFDEFQESTGIANATLTSRLKDLEAHGIIARHPYQERPPRHEYRLTEKGRDLWKVLTALREWGDKWDASGYGAAPIEAVDRKTGRQLELAMIDPETRCEVPRERVTLKAGPGADETTHARLANIGARK